MSYYFFSLHFIYNLFSDDKKKNRTKFLKELEDENNQ